jgi:WD40 repeat protein
VEKERLEQLQTQFPPVNPEDPYAHPETRDSFLQFHPLCTMQESHPIRTVSFSPYGEAFCVGTNSKALRICKLAPDGDAIEVLHERANHHKGSVYCSSWNCESRLVATGSTDKTVKVVKVFLEDEGTGAGIVSNSIEQVRAREARPPCDPLSSQTVISSHRRASSLRSRAPYS